MRVVEKQMIEAVRECLNSGKSRTIGNTRVQPKQRGTVEVRLHGNLIAQITSNGGQFTLAGWDTVTTRSRVNALLREFSTHAYVSRKKFVPHYTTVGRATAPISANEWYPFSVDHDASDV